MTIFTPQQQAEVDASIAKAVAEAPPIDEATRRRLRRLLGYEDTYSQPEPVEPAKPDRRALVFFEDRRCSLTYLVPGDAQIGSRVSCPVSWTDLPMPGIIVSFETVYEGPLKKVLS